MGYSGAWGTLIYEKNLKAKISCQTPFKIILVLWYIFLKSSRIFWKRSGESPERNTLAFNGLSHVRKALLRHL